MPSMPSSSGVQPPQMLAFLHIPKTAGITLAKLLEREYGFGSVFLIQPGPLLSGSVDRFLNMNDQERKKIRVVWGHFYFGIHSLLQRPCTYITILRDPIERVISHYYYVRRMPAHEEYPFARNLGLEEFVATGISKTIDNGQVRQLCGVPEAALGPRLESVSDDWLQQARNNLRDHFAVVGLTEEFDKTCLLLKHQFGWKNTFHYSANATGDRPQQDDVDASVIKLIRERNQHDCELYEYARQLFNAQLAKEPDTFNAELEAFRRKNRSYGRAYAFAADGWKRVVRTMRKAF